MAKTLSMQDKFKKLDTATRKAIDTWNERSLLKIGKTKNLSRSDCDIILDFCAMQRVPDKWLVGGTPIEEVFVDFDLTTEVV